MKKITRKHINHIFTKLERYMTTLQEKKLAYSHLTEARRHLKMASTLLRSEDHVDTRVKIDNLIYGTRVIQNLITER